MKILENQHTKIVSGGMSAKGCLITAGGIALAGVSVGLMQHVAPLAGASGMIDQAIKGVLGLGIAIPLLEMMGDTTSAYYEATIYPNVLHIHELD